MDARQHWDSVYRTKAPDQVSWFSPHLNRSLELIERAAPDHAAAIIDVGAGASTLADDLIERGYTNITITDISQTALDLAVARLRDRSEVRCVRADVTQPNFSANAYDVWHDRAVFHFLTEPQQRLAYVQNVARAVKPGGYVIVSTFGPEGPTKCSGLDVVRYDATSLHGQFGARFRLMESTTELHLTPFGSKQQFLYCFCRLES